MKKQLELIFIDYFKEFSYPQYEKGDMIATPIEAKLIGEIKESNEDKSFIKNSDLPSTYECNCYLEESLWRFDVDHKWLFKYEDIYFFVTADKPLEPHKYYNFECTFQFPDEIDNVSMTMLFPYEGIVPVFTVDRILKSDEDNFIEVDKTESNEDLTTLYKLQLSPVEDVVYDNIKVWNPISSTLIMEAFEKKFEDDYPFLRVNTSNKVDIKGFLFNLEQIRYFKRIYEEDVPEFIQQHYAAFKGELPYFGKITGYTLSIDKYKHKFFNLKGEEINIKI